MIFEVLSAAAKRDELILVGGGLCHWHLRRDGQLTIREIIVLPPARGKGIGRTMLRKLCVVPGATSIVAKCPADLDANSWYEQMGFEHVGTHTTKSGREVFTWRMSLL